MHNMFGHTFMQSQRQNERIRKGVWNTVSVQQSRHLRLSTKAMESLGNVEDHIPVCPTHQPNRQLSYMADALRGISQTLQRLLERFDSLEAVKLYRFLFAIAGC